MILDITCASWYLESLATLISVQNFVQANNKEIIEALLYLSFNVEVRVCMSNHIPLFYMAVISVHAVILMLV